MNSSVQMDVKVLANKCELFGLIDRTYQIEALYRKGELQQGTFILDSLRESLKELCERSSKLDNK
ncbi:TPA: hypothetical protein I8Y83_002746 [Legionella pneumophila]|uniref:Uncharacterized protein n=2 Tax=Legionella bozemanae TaxID=447 RepID=A0A0W0RF32_LEGBO|nr:hypothetical protein [Legionella bozemanae]KTC69579.1 hypothetical protein Lboz_3095 [Legionella bozemanae]STP13857.1 Uncharacterised protein [Legionella bozemanae]HAT1722195.1 hypothetical protein [Legionella pneumophila]